MRKAVAAILLFLLSVPALAETVIVALSRPTIAVRSNFSGTQIVVFGGIERDGVTVARRGYDIVAVIRGPRADTTVRRKDRILGMWINRSAETYDDLPGYYAVLANRPVADIASERYRQDLHIGTETLIERPAAFANAETEETTQTPFGDALVSQRASEGLFVEDEEGVAFLGRSMFRGTAILPASVPIGTYTVDVHLFSGGALLSSATADFLLHKEGFEEMVSSASRERPALYGMATIALAFFTGWLGSVVFRRN